MSLECCPCCGGSRCEPLEAWARCLGCGHRWRQPADPQALRYEAMSARNDISYASFTRKLRDRLDTLLPLLPEVDTPCRVLEVGCAEGQLGEALKAVHPLTYDGIEVSRDADVAAKRIDTVFRQTAAFVTAQPYDHVLAFHVLEHIPELLTELLEWRRLLLPGGRMVLEVPHEGGNPLVITDENVEHLHQFTWSSLLCLLHAAGLEAEAMSGGHYESSVYADSLRVVARVRESTASRRDRLVARFNEHMGGGPFLIYGIGGDFRNYVLPVLDRLPVQELLDSSAEKWGTTCVGRVIGKYDAQRHRGLPVLACSVRFKASIVASLSALGIPDQLIVALDEVYDPT